MPSVGKRVQLPTIHTELDYIYDAGLNPGLSTYWTATAELVMVEIDNTIGAADVYLKLWDLAEASTDPILGTDPPDMQFPCPALSVVSYPIVSKGYTERPLFILGVYYAISTKPGTDGDSSDIPETDTDPTIRMMVRKF